MDLKGISRFNFWLDIYALNKLINYYYNDK